MPEITRLTIAGEIRTIEAAVALARAIAADYPAPGAGRRQPDVQRPDQALELVAKATHLRIPLTMTSRMDTASRGTAVEAACRAHGLSYALAVDELDEWVAAGSRTVWRPGQATPTVVRGFGHGDDAVVSVAEIRRLAEAGDLARILEATEVVLDPTTSLPRALTASRDVSNALHEVGVLWNKRMTAARRVFDAQGFPTALPDDDAAPWDVSEDGLTWRRPIPQDDNVSGPGDTFAVIFAGADATPAETRVEPADAEPGSPFSP